MEKVIGNTKERERGGGAENEKEEDGEWKK